MACIVLVGGVIGCGKTTFINYLKNKIDIFNCSDFDNGEHAKIFTIHFDNVCSIEEQEQLMKTLRGWRNFRVDLLIAVERLISLSCYSENSVAGPLTERSNKLLEKLNSNCSNLSKAIILVEDNFYYRSMRYDWFQIARRNNLGFATVFLHCPLNIAVHRNSTRGYHIPEDRIEKMLSIMELPDPVKFKWEKYSIMFESSSQLTCTTLTGVVNMIEEALKHPAELVISEDKIAAQRICSKNAVHQVDKILRKIVSKRIACLKADNLEEEAFDLAVAHLVKIRHEILLNFKTFYSKLSQDSIQRICDLCTEDMWYRKMWDGYEDNLEKFDFTLFEKSLEGIVDPNILQTIEN